MVELVDDRSLRCELNGDRTGDRLRRDLLPEGADIAAEMVTAGVACPLFSGGRYRDAESQVVAAGAAIADMYQLTAYCRQQ